KNREELPGALTQQELDRTPRRADPANLMLRVPAARNYDYGRGALTIRTPLSETQALEWGTQLNYQDLHHPLSFAVIDDTTWAYSTELRWTQAAPLFGVVWRAAKTVQVYANASRTYEPPLLLELTAPGQLQGNLGQLAAQKAWQFEVGTRGEWGSRLAWDLAVYDIELWDEIQNVNVLPFPFACFTIPPYRNIDRSRHTGLEAGADLLLAKDIARSVGLGSTGDALRVRGAYTFSRFVFVNDVNFGDNDLPGAPRHFVRAEFRYDHGSGAWIAPH